MSFHFQYTAANKADALAILDQQYVPPSVKSFVIDALTSLVEDGLVYVKAQGHLATSTDYQTSTANIEVYRIKVQAAPTPPEQEPETLADTSGGTTTVSGDA